MKRPDSTNEATAQRRARKSADMEALIADGQQFFAAAFPNPERRGCPAPEALSALVAAEQLPDAELRAHLFHCSECFNQYRAAVSEQRQPAQPRQLIAPTRTWTRWLVARRGWRAPALASAVALLLAAGIFLWPTRRQTPPTDYISPQPGAAARQEATTPPAPPTAADPQPSAPRLLARHIDLNDYTALATVERGGAQPERKPIKLPPAQLQLNLRLPAGSAPGRYQVSLVDAFYQPRARAQGRSADGRHLQVKLDLRGLRGHDYTLRLTRGQTAPDDYPAVITSH